MPITLELDTFTVNAEEALLPVPVTGSVLGDFAGTTVTLTVNGKQFMGGVDGSGNFSIPVPGQDLVDDPDKVFQGSAINGALEEDTEAQIYIVDLVATVTINTVAGDDVVDAGEAGAVVVISGTTTGVENGRILDVRLDGFLLGSATVNNNAWSLNIPAGTFVPPDGTFVLAAFVDDVAGNLATTQKNLTLSIQGDLVNDPPTAVTLTQQVPSVAENGGMVTVATIVITDDLLSGPGGNALSLTGADAASFIIAGNELRFKGDADFETKTSYQVAVQVNDAAVGTDPDATSAIFNLAITNVNGATIAGTNGKDTIDATHGPKGPGSQIQVSTNENDTINGKGGNDKIAGLAGADNIKGGSGKDKLDGGADDDLLNGGGDKDTFVFANGYDHDTVKGYKGGKEAFDLSGTDVTSFAALKALMTNVGGDVVIDFLNGDMLTILNNSISDLKKGDFDF